MNALVLILMGSESDLPKLGPAFTALDDLEIPHEASLISAHRDPERVATRVAEFESAGGQVIICAAGLAAHLAGAVAGRTIRPVIGLPLSGGPLSGMDALLSTVQMPKGVPVATVGVDQAENAALLAGEILALSDRRLADRMAGRRMATREALRERDAALQASGPFDRGR